MSWLVQMEMQFGGAILILAVVLLFPFAPNPSLCQQLPRQTGEETIEFEREARQGVQEYGRRLQMLYRTAESLAELGDFEEALRYYEEALQLQRRNRDQRGASTTLMAIGDTYLFRMGSPEKALDYYKQSLDIKQAVKDKKGEPEVLHQMAYAYYMLGQNDRSDELYHNVLDLARKAKNRRAEGTALNGIGNCLLAKGRAEEAINYYQQALPLRKKAKDERGSANTTYNLGRAYAALGRHEKASDYFQQALKLRREILDVRAETETLLDLARTAIQLRQIDQAEGYFSEAITLGRRIKSQRIELEALYGIGVIQLRAGKPQNAIPNLQQALNLIGKNGNDRDRAGKQRLLVTLGSAYFMAKQDEEASRTYVQALQLAREARDRLSEAEILANLGQVNAARQKAHQALACYFQSELTLKDLNSPAVGMVQEQVEVLRKQLGEEQFARIAENVRANLVSFLRDATGISEW